MAINSYVAIAEKIVSILEAASVSLGIKAVYYGDQAKLPTTPVVCVEPEIKANNLAGATRVIDINISIVLLVYHSSVRSPISNRKDSDTLAEEIETLLHSNPTLDGLVIHSLVTEIASGYATKADTLVRASRITFTARSRNILPS